MVPCILNADDNREVNETHQNIMGNYGFDVRHTEKLDEIDEIIKSNDVDCIHLDINFDLILSFDLSGVGNFAWRAGRDIKIPAAGWSFGSDIRISVTSVEGKVMKKTLKRLDLIFYQSSELYEIAKKFGQFSSEEGRNKNTRYQ